MGKGARNRRKRAAESRRRAEAKRLFEQGPPSSSASAQAYCAQCRLTFEGALSGAVLDVEYEHEGRRHKRLFPAEEMALPCPSCGAICRVTNLLTMDVPGGAVTTFGSTAEELRQARDLADFFAATATINWGEAADEIERRAPWLTRLAEEIRSKPLTSTGVGVALAALILQIYTVAQEEHGITEEQFERLIEEIHRLPRDAPSESSMTPGRHD